MAFLTLLSRGSDVGLHLMAGRLLIAGQIWMSDSEK
jgi:hypothetical protein